MLAILMMKNVYLLDAHVFNGRQEIAKPIVTNLLFHGFLRFLFLFTILYILGVKKHTLFKKFLSQKDSQFDRTKETYAMKEKVKVWLVKVCMYCPIPVSLHLDLEN